MKQKHIIVAGGAGFIGSNLCQHLVGQGHHVLCLDNLYTGRRENIEHLMGNPNFQFVQHDVTRSFLSVADEIYNLACPASPIHYQHNPTKTIRTSVIGTANLLETAQKTGAKILLASTSEVYGDAQISPQVESYWGNVNPIGIRSCYDEGKRCAEALMMDYRRQFGTEVRIIRIFNTYGPRMRMDDGRVMTQLISQALKGEPLTLYGDGGQTRSFMYVDDLIRGMERVMEQAEAGPFNIGNPEEISIKELAGKILRLTGYRSTIEYRELPQDDPRQRRPEISRMKSLGWEPRIGLEKGLQRMVDYCREVVEKDCK